MEMMKMQNEQNNVLSKHRLKRKICEYDFAIVETGLFLDTHSNNLKALQYYSKLRAERSKLVAEYEHKFGPLTMSGNVNDKRWDWISGPWPWEGEK